MSDMIMKTHKSLWDILFSKQASDVSVAFCNLGPLLPWDTSMWNDLSVSGLFKLFGVFRRTERTRILASQI